MHKCTHASSDVIQLRRPYWLLAFWEKKKKKVSNSDTSATATFSLWGTICNTAGALTLISDSSESFATCLCCSVVPALNTLLLGNNTNTQTFMSAHGEVLKEWTHTLQRPVLCIPYSADKIDTTLIFFNSAAFLNSQMAWWWWGSVKIKGGRLNYLGCRHFFSCVVVVVLADNLMEPRYRCWRL